MTRYFYRDPLAAALMWKRYGMHFELRINGGLAAAGFELSSSRLEFGTPPDDGQYLVRAESLAMLRPQLGDLIERHDCFHFVVSPEEHGAAEAVWTFKNQTVSLELLKAWPDPEDTFIRMRGGEVFIHPEREWA